MGELSIDTSRNTPMVRGAFFLALVIFGGLGLSGCVYEEQRGGGYGHRYDHGGYERGSYDRDGDRHSVYGRGYDGRDWH
jgi:hypothetical protein